MTTTTTATRTNRTNRRPAPRVEGLALSHADSAPALDPEIAERIRKEEEKLAREEKAAAARRARIEAYKTGKPIPPAGSKGLPPVVKMNELGSLARNLHRAAELLGSDEVRQLMVGGYVPVAREEAAAAAAQLRDLAMVRWLAQLEERTAAGAGDNDTLHPLGLVDTRTDEGTGKVSLVEKPKSK